MNTDKYIDVKIHTRSEKNEHTHIHTHTYIQKHKDILINTGITEYVNNCEETRTCERKVEVEGTRRKD